jgi:hypothetical protein
LTFTPATLAYVREDVPAGWTLSNAACVIQTGGAGTPTGTADTQSDTGGKGVSSVEIREGLETVCTFVDARDNPSVTLTKSVIDPYTPAALPGAWTLTATNTSTSVSKQFTSGVADQLAPGVYRLAESGGPAGYSAGAWSCSIVGNGAVTLGGANADELTVESGKNISCSITNTAQPATLIVKKAVTNDNGGTKLAAAFSFTVTGVTGTFSFDGADADDPGNTLKGSHTLTNLAPGTYSVTETTTSAVGYTVSYTTATCKSVVLQRGGSATCVITNDDDKAAAVGSTDQNVILHDSVSFSPIVRGASNAANARAIFRLYSDQNCNTQVGADESVSLTFADANATTGTAKTSNGVKFDPASNLAQNGTFRWRVEYTGDNNNAQVFTTCGSEITTVALNPN